MFLYEHDTGRFRTPRVLLCVGYSGFQEGKNNPLLQNVIRKGPICEGVYWIGLPFDSPDHGPVSMHLIPVSGTETYGRSGFLIHGDSAAHPGEASHGCIILPRPIREQVAASHDKLLVVLPGLPPSQEK